MFIAIILNTLFSFECIREYHGKKKTYTTEKIVHKKHKEKKQAHSKKHKNKPTAKIEQEKEQIHDNPLALAIREQDRPQKQIQPKPLVFEEDEWWRNPFNNRISNGESKRIHKIANTWSRMEGGNKVDAQEHIKSIQTADGKTYQKIVNTTITHTRYGKILRSCTKRLGDYVLSDRESDDQNQDEDSK